MCSLSKASDREQASKFFTVGNVEDICMPIRMRCNHGLHGHITWKCMAMWRYYRLLLKQITDESESFQSVALPALPGRLPPSESNFSGGLTSELSTAVNCNCVMATIVHDKCSWQVGLWVWSQPGLHGDFQASQDYLVRPCFFKILREGIHFILAFI